MWKVEIKLSGKLGQLSGQPWDNDGYWVTLARGFASRGDAEWAVGQWKQANKITADPFRYRMDSVTPEVDLDSMMNAEFNVSP